MRRPRAIVFDLDDTLYPYRAFVRSGFHAVGRRLAEERGLPKRAVLKVLRGALTAGARGRELQVLCDRFALSPQLVPVLADVIREHTPTLRLPAQTRRVLTLLRGSWRIGVLTNGTPRIQCRKVRALDLEQFVDAVVFAADYGGGKPHALSFHAALTRLGATPSHTVFVGDNRAADIDGAAAVGMNAIHLRTQSAACNCAAAGVAVDIEALEQVPETADRLVPIRTESHVF